MAATYCNNFSKTILRQTFSKPHAYCSKQLRNAKDFICNLQGLQNVYLYKRIRHNHVPAQLTAMNTRSLLR